VSRVIYAADVLVGVIGLMMAAAGGYVMNSEFSVYLAGFLGDLFTLITVVGVFTFVVSLIGCCGVVKQEQEGGRSLLTVYQVGSILFLIAIGTVGYQIFAIVESFQVVSDDLSEPFFAFEADLSGTFNDIYFKAVCEESSYDHFWGIVEDNCPTSMNEDSCGLTCNYIGTGCPTQGSCESDEDYQQDGCPYVTCRQGMVDYMVGKLEPLSTLVIFFGAVLALNSLMNLLMLCYNRKDSTEIMLAKTGVISYRKAMMLAMQRGTSRYG
jgi:hypothetical protein